jgi:hypothetical protein
LTEFLNATCGVHDLLLAGVERMALGTDFDVEIATSGGAGLELVAATAGDSHVRIIWMNIGFHARVSFSSFWAKGAIINEMRELINHSPWNFI